MPEYATPGDPLNYCEIMGMTLKNIVRLGDDFIITGDGGEGFWEEDGERWQVENVQDFEITAGVENPVAAEVVLDQVQTWVDRGTEIHVILCDGKFTTLIDHAGERLLPLPVAKANL